MKPKSNLTFFFQMTRQKKGGGVYDINHTSYKPKQTRSKHATSIKTASSSTPFKCTKWGKSRYTVYTDYCNNYCISIFGPPCIIAVYYRACRSVSSLFHNTCTLPWITGCQPVWHEILPKFAASVWMEKWFFKALQPKSGLVFEVSKSCAHAHAHAR